MSLNKPNKNQKNIISLNDLQPTPHDGQLRAIMSHNEVELEAMGHNETQALTMNHNKI